MPIYYLFSQAVLREGFFAIGGEVALVAMGSFLIIALALSFYRYQLFLEQNVLGEETEMGGQFRLLVANQLGLIKYRGREWVVALIKVTAESGQELDQESSLAIRDKFKGQIRRNDVCYRLNSSLFGVVLGMEGVYAHPVFKRLLNSISKQDFCRGFGEKWYCCAGVAVSSVHGRVSAKLCQVAHDSLDEVWKTENGSVLVGEGLEDVDPGEDYLAHDLSGVIQADRLASNLRRFLGKYRRKWKMFFFYLVVNDMERVTQIHGAEAADAMRVRVGVVLQNKLRIEDVVGRYDEDTFLVVGLCDYKQALSVAQRINSTISAEQVDCKGRKLRCSVTVGVALRPKHGIMLGPLFDASSTAYAKAEERKSAMSVLYEEWMSDD